jgi:hypothetical protein
MGQSPRFIEQRGLSVKCKRKTVPRLTIVISMTAAQYNTPLIPYYPTLMLISISSRRHILHVEAFSI